MLPYIVVVFTCVRIVFLRFDCINRLMPAFTKRTIGSGDTLRKASSNLMRNPGMMRALPRLKPFNVCVTQCFSEMNKNPGGL